MSAFLAKRLGAVRLPLLFCLSVFCNSAIAESAAQASCPLLSAADVITVFPASDTEASAKYREKPYPSCTFVWKSNKPKTMILGGQQVEVPGEGRLSVTRAPVRTKSSDWQRVLSSYGSEELIQVPNIGEQAVWSPKRRQLSVLSAEAVVHVAVENPDQLAAEQASAEKIAQLLLGEQ